MRVIQTDDGLISTDKGHIPLHLVNVKRQNTVIRQNNGEVQREEKNKIKRDAGYHDILSRMNICIRNEWNILAVQR